MIVVFGLFVGVTEHHGRNISVNCQNIDLALFEVQIQFLHGPHVASINIEFRVGIPSSCGFTLECPNASVGNTGVAHFLTSPALHVDDHNSHTGEECQIPSSSESHNDRFLFQENRCFGVKLCVDFLRVHGPLVVSEGGEKVAHLRLVGTHVDIGAQRRRGFNLQCLQTTLRDVVLEPDNIDYALVEVEFEVRHSRLDRLSLVVLLGHHVGPNLKFGIAIAQAIGSLDTKCQDGLVRNREIFRLSAKDTLWIDQQNPLLGEDNHVTARFEGKFHLFASLKDWDFSVKRFIYGGRVDGLVVVETAKPLSRIPRTLLQIKTFDGSVVVSEQFLCDTFFYGENVSFILAERDLDLGFSMDVGVEDQFRVSVQQASARLNGNRADGAPQNTFEFNPLAHEALDIHDEETKRGKDQKVPTSLECHIHRLVLEKDGRLGLEFFFNVLGFELVGVASEKAHESGHGSGLLGTGRYDFVLCSLGFVVHQDLGTQKLLDGEDIDATLGQIKCVGCAGSPNIDFDIIIKDSTAGGARKSFKRRVGDGLEVLAHTSDSLTILDQDAMTGEIRLVATVAAIFEGQLDGFPWFEK
mmetsp:Transcript_76414/g.115017  ORF Transcript_76414/g.115017 Transcript_76414/m.115017 type:complete len:582 (-) Transcript_76414:134-1879(-)